MRSKSRGELLLRFTVRRLASNQDVYSALTTHYTETFGRADTRTGALDPTRRRVLTGWGRAADPQPFPRPTTDDGTVVADGGISLHSPNPNGNTAPDGRIRINAPFNCREAQRSCASRSCSTTSSRTCESWIGLQATWLRSP